MYTIDQTIRHAGQVFGDHEASSFAGRSRSYRELAERVLRVGQLVSSLTEPGDRVALWSLNSDTFLELFFGIPAAGRVIVPHNTRWADPELVYATADAGAKVLFCDRDPGGMADIVDRVIRLDTEYEALIHEQPAEELTTVDDITPDTLAGLFYTGGTTGKSKGVMLTHANLMANAIHTQIVQPFVAEDRYLTMAPMFHAAGVYSALALPLVGASNVILPGFDPVAVLDTIASDGITGAIAVPTMLAAMCELQATDPRDVSSLSWLSHGASPVALEVLRRADELFGCELIHLYGATETAPLVTIMRHEERYLDHERAKSCGQAPPGVAIRIVGDDGAPLPTREVGEVAMRGPNVMIGYWDKPDQTAAALSDDGWYRSGDVGFVDEEGFLFLVDRAKDMIVTGGENVYCTEVEDAIYTHPAVLEAAVIGIPDERWGEKVCAIVVPREGEDVDEAAIIEHCRGQIAAYKVPKTVSIQGDALPKSGPGKVLKRVLREPYWGDQERSIN